MRRPALIRILLLAAGPLWLAGPAIADGIRSYDRVVDLGQQKYTYITEFPGIDQAGNLVHRTNPLGGSYQLDAILDPTREGGILGHTLNKAGDSTNLLPPSISGPSEVIWGPNASGHVVGTLSVGGYPAYFFAPQDGRLTWLKSLPGMASPIGIYGINSLDQLVGYQGGKAIYYASPTSEPVELSSLLTTNTGWRFDLASDINNRGEIIGYGINPTGQLANFKLEPSAVPEPTTLAMLALSGLLIVARKYHCGR